MMLGKSVYSVLPSFESLESFLKDDHWKLVKEKRDSQGAIYVQGFTRPPPGIESAQNMNKVTSLVKSNINAMLDLFHYNLGKRQAEFCPSCSSSRVIEQVDHETFVLHQKYKLPFPLANREMVVAHTRINLPDGRIALIDKSVPHPAVPEERGVIRSKTILFLRLLQPVDGGVLMTNMQWYNLGGRVPSALIDMKALDALIEEVELAQRVLDTPQQAPLSPSSQKPHHGRWYFW